MRANLLIIDCRPSETVGASLHEMLEQAGNVQVRLHRQAAEDFCRLLQSTSRSSSLFNVHSDAVFLVLSCKQLHHVDAFISFLKKKPSSPPVILVHQECDPGIVLKFFRLGIADCIASPLRPVDVLPRLWRLLEHTRSSSTLVHTLKKKLGLEQLVGESPAFRSVTAKIPLIASSDAGVYISGETGTGKELCARAIHYLGPRAGKSFLPVNCGAIPADLVENELFGHVRGAFTGATLSHGGLIQEANGGTLLLDEIDCLPLCAQVKLLRFVQEKEYRQLGSTKVHNADVRIIAATNTDLARAAREGTFRQDLFYRLSIIHLALPPLRERRADIPLLARHFLAACIEEMRRKVTDFTPEAINALCRYDWPGNVRELENIVKGAVVLSMEGLIEAESLALPRQEKAEPCASFRAQKARVVAEFEKRYMQDLLHKHHGNISQAAKEAQKNRRAFWELMRKHAIDIQQFRRPLP